MRTILGLEDGVAVKKKHMWDPLVERRLPLPTGRRGGSKTMAQISLKDLVEHFLQHFPATGTAVTQGTGGAPPE